jgi:hypothetical protein
MLPVLSPRKEQYFKQFTDSKTNYNAYTLQKTRTKLQSYSPVVNLWVAT